MKPTLLCALLALAGCSASGSGFVTGSIEAAGPQPETYRQIVLDNLKQTLFDPYSVRDAQISRPRPGSAHLKGGFSHAEGWAVCVRANAKNRMGGYTGVRDTLLILRNGSVVAVQDDSTHYDVRTNCGGATYDPFPELEALA
jgi:hypothetical protein